VANPFRAFTESLAPNANVTGDRVSLDGQLLPIGSDLDLAKHYDASRTMSDYFSSFPPIFRSPLYQPPGGDIWGPLASSFVGLGGEVVDGGIDIWNKAVDPENYKVDSWGNRWDDLKANWAGAWRKPVEKIKESGLFDHNPINVIPDWIPMETKWDTTIPGAAGISTADLLRRALTDQGLQQDARKIKPLGGGGLLSAALRNAPSVLGRGLGWGSAFVPSAMDSRRYTDRKGRVVTPDGSKVTLTDELLGATVGRGSVPTGTTDRLKENRLSMIPFAINPATDRYEETYPPYFNEVVSGQPGPVDDSRARQAREAEQSDSSNAIQAREAEARAQAKKENKAKTEKVKTATTKALESVIKSSSFGGGLSKKQKKEVAKVVTSSKNISNATAAARGDVKSAVTIALTSGDTQRAWAKSKGIDPSTVYGSTLRRTAGGGWAGGF